MGVTPSRLERCGPVRARAALLGLFAGALVPGCGLLPGRSTAPELRLAHEASLTTLDPADATDHIAISILSNVYDSLVDFDTQMRLVPALARSWSTPDELTWVFDLREDLIAHDGGRLDAQDVCASLERARDAPGSSLRERLAGLERIEAPSPSQVRIHTRRPDPLLAHRLAVVMIAPRRALATIAERPVGTGAYRFVARDGEALVGEAFAGWRGRPAVRRVRFVTVVPGEATAGALAAGAADVLRWVPEERVAEIATLDGFTLVSRPSLRAVYLWFGLRAPEATPLVDARVRRGLSLAIDRGALVERLGGHARPLWQHVPEEVVGHVPGHELRYDPAAARTLLREAGQPDPLELTLTVGEGGEALGAAVAEQLASVGVRLRVEALDWPTMRARWHAGSLAFFVGSWRFASGEASFFFQECLESRRSDELRRWNPGFASPQLDLLIGESLRVFGSTKREGQFAALAQALAEEMPLVPLVSREDLYAVSKRVRFEPRLDGNLRAAEMAWVSAPEPR